MSLSRRNIISTLVVSAFLGVVNVSATEIPAGSDGFKSKIAPLLATYCVKCHGPTKSKGGITLHTMEGDFSTEQKLNRWEMILHALNPVCTAPTPAATNPPRRAITPTLARWRKASTAWLQLPETARHKSKRFLLPRLRAAVCSTGAVERTRRRDDLFNRSSYESRQLSRPKVKRLAIHQPGDRNEGAYRQGTHQADLPWS